MGRFFEWSVVLGPAAWAVYQHGWTAAALYQWGAWMLIFAAIVAVLAFIVPAVLPTR